MQLVRSRAAGVSCRWAIILALICSSLISLCRYSRLAVADETRTQVKPHSNSQVQAVADVVPGTALNLGNQATSAAPDSQIKSGRPTQRERGRLAETYSALPLSFERNQGQTDRQVKFLSRGQGYTLFLTGHGAVLELQNSGVRSQKPAAKEEIRNSKLESRVLAPHSSLVSRDLLRTMNTILRMELVGANPNAGVTGMDELPGKSNYFIGNRPGKWRTHIPTYAKVRYQNSYPGVDLTYYGNSGRLEYDFVVAPGADPGAITLGIRAGSKSALRIDSSGNLVVPTDGGEVHFLKPVAYQAQPTTGESAKRLVEARYVLKSRYRVGLQLGAYDNSRPVVIDPALSYSTYLGGTVTNTGSGIAVDTSGDVYVTGTTASPDFPVTPGVLQGTFKGQQDAFVTKINADGSALVYSTYLGGSAIDSGLGIAVDNSGAAYVTGSTNSTDFPTTTGVRQPTLKGGLDAFVTKLSADGTTLVYSTYLGGSQDDTANAIALDSSGEAYVTGVTLSTDFPTTKLAFQGATGGGQDAFVTKLNATATAPSVYSTYLGGGGNDVGHDIAVDSTGNAYVVGETTSTNFPVSTGAAQSASGGGTDAFLAKINPAGLAAASLIYSTYLGGSSDDLGLGIALDSSNNAYVTGETQSTNFPVTAGVLQIANGGSSDAFVTELNAGGTAFIYSTYLGGTGAEVGNSIAVDSSGNAYVTGNTQSSNFPTLDPIQSACTGLPCNDAFVASLNAGASKLNYSTFLGGSLEDVGQKIALDSAANAYVAGSTSSTDFPTTPGAFQASCALSSTSAACSSAFVIKIGPAAAVQASPMVLPFGLQLVGTTSAAQTTTLSNNSTSTLTISTIVASGDFAVSSSGTTCSAGSPVAAGASCTVAVTFTPTTTGARTGTITITDDAANSPQTVDLTGTGTSSVVSLSVTSLTFSNQFVGTTSAPQMVTLTNSGAATLTITSITATSGFAETNTCGSSLAGGASCTISVTFTPTTASTVTGTVTITDSATDSPQTISLTGSGVAPGISLSPTSVDFGSQNVNTGSAQQTIMVKNTGNTSLTITSVVLGGANSGDFAFAAPSSGPACNPTATVTAGSSCNLSVTFKPTAPGTRTATITIADNAPGSPQTIGLSGMGADFSVSVSPSTATVKAGQSATFTLSIASVGGFNSTVALSCTGAPPLGSCTISPTSVTPSGATAATATVTVGTTAPSMLAPKAGPHPMPPPALPRFVWLLALGVLLALSSAPVGRRRARLGPAVILLFVALWTACGGTTNPATAAGTTPGTYTMTISGTSGTLAHSTPVTVTVTGSNG